MPTIPFLPPELWLQVLTHIDDPVFLWRMHRLGPSFLRAPSYSLVRNDWIVHRTLCDYQHDCWIGGRFSHHAADDSKAYFYVGLPKDKVRGDGVRGLNRSNGLDIQTGRSLYIVVHRISPNQERLRNQALLSANFMRGDTCTEKVTVKWEHEQGDVTDEPWVHVEREKGIVGFDWQSLMDRFLMFSRSKETFGGPDPYTLPLP